MVGNDHDHRHDRDFLLFHDPPSEQKQKEIKKAREAMTKGDKVITAGGIYGTVRSVNEADNTMLIEVAKDVTIKVSREQIYPAGPEAPVKDNK